jgi:hypothetical protein
MKDGHVAVGRHPEDLSARSSNRTRQRRVWNKGHDGDRLPGAGAQRQDDRCKSREQHETDDERLAP